MRVLVASDMVGALGSAAAGQVLGAAWAERGAEVTVVPAGEAGAGCLAAAASASAVRLEVHAQDAMVVTSGAGSGRALLRVEDPEPIAGLPLALSSAPLGRALAALLAAARPTTVLVDLTGLPVHDGGAGLLGALGATADRPLDAGADGLAGLTRVDVTPARALLQGVDLVGVVPPQERERPLLGLRGITSLRGREAGLDPAVLLRVDADLTTLAAQVAPGHAGTPGAGACGGLGLAVLALGGRLSTGAALTLGAAPVAAVDLVVTGCSVFDFGSRGGGVVAEAARRAAEVLAPCVVVAGEVLIGSREMRTMGIEAAYGVRASSADAPAGGVGTDELAATARRVARSWSW